MRKEGASTSAPSTVTFGAWVASAPLASGARRVTGAVAFHAPSSTAPVTVLPSTVTTGGVLGAWAAGGLGGVWESSVQAARYSPPKSPRR